MITRKDNTVKMVGIVPEMIVALILVDQVFDKYSLGTIITAGAEEFYPDGKRIHMVGSKHITGEALDFRSRHIPHAVYTKLCADIQDAVGAEFQLSRHRRHLHLEFDV